MGVESEWRMKVLRMEGCVINNMIISENIFFGGYFNLINFNFVEFSLILLYFSLSRYFSDMILLT